MLFNFKLRKINHKLDKKLFHQQQTWSNLEFGKPHVNWKKNTAWWKKFEGTTEVKRKWISRYGGSTETVTVVAAAAPAWAEVVAAAAPAAYVTLPAPRPVQSSLGHRAMRYIDPAAAASSPVDRWTPSARQDPSKSNSAALAVLHSTWLAIGFDQCVHWIGSDSSAVAFDSTVCPTGERNTRKNCSAARKPFAVTVWLHLERRSSAFTNIVTVPTPSSARRPLPSTTPRPTPHWRRKTQSLAFRRCLPSLLWPTIMRIKMPAMRIAQGRHASSYLCLLSCDEIIDGDLLYLPEPLVISWNPKLILGIFKSQVSIWYNSISLF